MSSRLIPVVWTNCCHINKLLPSRQIAVIHANCAPECIRTIEGTGSQCSLAMTPFYGYVARQLNMAWIENTQIAHNPLSKFQCPHKI